MLCSQVVRLYGINHPEGLLERLDPSSEGDLQSAIAIYEAYEDITPLFAQQDDLWVYLTHVDLFDTENMAPYVIMKKLQKMDLGP